MILTREESQLISLIIQDIEEHPEYDREIILKKHKDLLWGINEGYTHCSLKWHFNKKSMKLFFNKIVEAMK